MLGRRGGRGLRRHFRPRQIAHGRDDILADAATPEESEADIQASRDRLASSVDALAAKLDV